MVKAAIYQKLEFVSWDLPCIYLLFFHYGGHYVVELWFLCNKSSNGFKEQWVLCSASSIYSYVIFYVQHMMRIMVLHLFNKCNFEYIIILSREQWINAILRTKTWQCEAYYLSSKDDNLQDCWKKCVMLKHVDAFTLVMKINSCGNSFDRTQKLMKH